MTEEKQLQNAVITWLECQGAYVVSIKSGKLMAVYGGKVRMIHLVPAGTPDLSVIWNKRPLCIELKKDEETAAAWGRVVDRYIETGVCAKSNIPIITQHQCHKRIIRAGGEVIVCGSMKELEEDCKQLGFIPSPHFYDSAKAHVTLHPQKDRGAKKEVREGIPQDGRQDRGRHRGQVFLEIQVGKKTFRISGNEVFSHFLPIGEIKKGEKVEVRYTSDAHD